MDILHPLLVAASVAAASALSATEPVFAYSAEAGCTQVVDRAGHAVAPADASCGVYPADAVPRACGSIEVWLRPNEKGAEEGDRFILCGPGGWGPTGCPVLWRWEAFVRFDVDRGTRLVYGRVPDGLWRAGILNHLVATWNASGRVALYANGRLLSRREVEPWTPEPFATVVIGSDGQGRRHAEAEIRSLRFFECELTPGEVGARFAAVKMPRLTVRGAGHEVLVGPVGSVSLAFANVGTAAFRGDVEIARKGAAPQVFPDVAIPAGGSSLLEVSGPFAPEPDGRILVESRWHEGPDLSLTRRDRTVFYVPPQLEPPAARAPEWRRVRAFDPAAKEPAAALGATAVAVLPDGFRYREGGNGKHNRFAYVCELPGTNLLLRFRVKVPDDKKRAMMISQTQPDFARTATCGTEQQVLGSGVMCGGEVPLSGRVLELEYVFRHPSRWIGLVFEATAPGEPAAAGPFSIDYAVASDRYGPAAAAPAKGARAARRAGLYWEDPVLSMNFGGLGGVDYVTYDRDLRRALDYFAWTGQDLMFYPTVWYNGPVYASRAEKGSWPSGQRHHPGEFPRLFAARCSERGIRFVPDLAMSMLPTLLPRLATPEAVRAGADAPNAVYADGTVATGAARMERPPVLNALHPEVQSAVSAVVEEHLAMCADLPAFGGVSLSLNMWNPTQFGLWLESSYDDWTMRAFARFRGEALPGDPESPERFTRRADWIRKDPARREAFLNWRADRVCAFYEALAGRIAAAKRDAKLYLRLDVPNIALDCISDGIFKKGPTSADSFREMGLDVARLAGNPAIVLDRLFSYGLVRNEEQYRPRARMPHPFADLEEAFQRPLLGFCDAATIHQYYFETHGDIRRGNTMTMPAPWTREALGRCAAPLLPGRHMLGYYAKALALFDPFEICAGGFTLGTHGAEALVRDWTRAFRALPDVKFREVRRAGDVLLRTAEAEGSRWYYLLNAGEAETNVVLDVAGPCVNAATGEDLKPGPLALPAYALRAFRLPAGTDLDLRADVRTIPACGGRVLRDTPVAVTAPDAWSRPDRIVISCAYRTRGFDGEGVVLRTRTFRPDGRFGVCLTPAVRQASAYDTYVFRTVEDWKEIRVEVDIPNAVPPKFCLEWEAKAAGGELEVRALSVEVLAKTRHSLAGGEAELRENTLRHVFFADEGTVEVRLAYPERNPTGRVTVRDEKSRMLREIPCGEACATSVRLPGRGYYSIDVRALYPDGTRIDTEESAVVLGPPLDDATVKGSRFGLMVVNGTAAFARNLGARWDQRFFFVDERKNDFTPVHGTADLIYTVANGVPVPRPLRAERNRERDGHFPPEDWDAYRTFLKGWLAAHSSVRGQRLCVSAESDFQWVGSDTDFVRTIRIFAEEVRRVYPETEISGPCASRLKLPYTKRMYAAGLFEVLDAVDMHTYVDGTRPEGEYYADLCALTRYLDDEIQCVKPLYITETGWTTVEGTWQVPVTEEAQARYLTRAMTLLATERVDGIVWFCDFFIARNYGDGGFSLLRLGNAAVTPKPAVAAFMAVTRNLSSVEGKLALRRLGPETYLATGLRCDGTTVGVLWRASGEGKLPPPLTAERAEDYLGRPVALTAELTVSESPLYLIGRDATVRAAEWTLPPDAPAAVATAADGGAAITLPAVSRGTRTLAAMPPAALAWLPAPAPAPETRLACGLEGFFLEVRVKDADHVQPYQQERLVEGDSLIVAFDADKSKEWESNNWRVGFKGHRCVEYVLGLAADGKTQVFRRNAWVPDMRPNLPVSSYVRARVRREKGETVYWAWFPWPALGLDLEPTAGTYIGFAAAVTDLGADGARRTSELFGGVLGVPNPMKYGTLRVSD